MDVAHLLLLSLAGAFASLWLPARRWRLLLALLLLGGAAVQALALGALAPVGVVWAVLLFVVLRHYHDGRAVWRYVARTLGLGLLLGLGFGLLPGFDAVVLAGPEILKPGAGVYTLRIRPDKALAGFALLAFVVPLTRDLHGWRRIVRVTLPAVAVSAPLVLGVAWLGGLVAFAAQVPALPWLAAWGLANLLFVAGVEEGFFRGVVQRALLPRIGASAAIALAAVLFGLAHLGGGFPFVLLATLAGLGYGVAYQLAGQRIEAAILCHFGVNLLHLLWFTYPYAW